MTITDDDALREHAAAVAVVIVDSEVGEDRVDSAPVEDWIAGRPMEGGLDGRMVDVSGGAAFLLCRRTSRLSSHAAQWELDEEGRRRGVRRARVTTPGGAPPSRHLLGPLHVALKAQVVGYLPVAIPIVPITDFIALGLCQQGAEPQQPDVAPR